MAIVKVGCSFIELIGAGVGDACISCAPNMVMLFWGAEVPGIVGATVRWETKEVLPEGPQETKNLG